MFLSHRAAEKRAECSLEEAADRDIMVATLTEELNMFREQLDDQTALIKRWSPYLKSLSTTVVA